MELEHINRFLEAYTLHLFKEREDLPVDRDFVRLILKLKPVQVIILEALTKATPYIEQQLYSRKRKRQIKTEQTKYRSLTPSKDISAEAYEMINVVHAMRKKMEQIQESVEEIKEWEIEEISVGISDCLASSETRKSYQHQLVTMLSELSEKPIPDFLNIKDISHEAWKDHSKGERELKRARNEYKFRGAQLESTYLYRTMHIKHKSGQKIKNLEDELTKLKEDYRFIRENKDMEINDLWSLFQEQQSLEDMLRAQNLDNIIADFPAALSTIEQLKTQRVVLEKKLKNAEKNYRNATHRMNVIGMANTELHATNSDLRTSVKYLEFSLLNLLEKSKIVDSDREKIKKYISNKKYAKLRDKLENDLVKQSASLEFLLQKFKEFRDEVNAFAMNSTDLKVSLGLHKLVEAYHLENSIEESEKQSFSLFNDPKPESPVDNKPVKRTIQRKRTLKVKNSLQKLYDRIEEEEGEEDELNTVSNESVETPRNETPVLRGERIDNYINNFTTRKSAFNAVSNLTTSETPQVKDQTSTDKTDAYSQTFSKTYSAKNTQTKDFSRRNIENIGNISIESYKQTQKESFRHYSIITRLKTPPELTIFKDSLLSLLKLKDLTLKEVLEQRIFKVPLHRIISEKIRQYLNRREAESQTDISAHIEDQSIPTRSRIKALVTRFESDNKFSAQQKLYKPLDIHEWAYKNGLNIKQAMDFVYAQIDIEVQRRGLKNVQDVRWIMEQVIDKRIESGEEDAISVFLRGNIGTDKYSQYKDNVIEFILRKDLVGLTETIHTLPLQLFHPKAKMKHSTLLKWVKFIEGVLANEARNTGNLVQSTDPKTLWFEMGKNIKYLRNEIDSRQKTPRLRQKNWVFNPKKTEKNKSTPRMNLNRTPKTFLKNVSMLEGKSFDSKQFSKTRAKLPHLYF